MIEPVNQKQEITSDYIQEALETQNPQMLAKVIFSQLQKTVKLKNKNKQLKEQIEWFELTPSEQDKRLNEQEDNIQFQNDKIEELEEEKEKFKNQSEQKSEIIEQKDEVIEQKDQIIEQKDTKLKDHQERMEYAKKGMIIGGGVGTVIGGIIGAKAGGAVGSLVLPGVGTISGAVKGILMCRKRPHMIMQ
jgi:6-phosphogluconate dehydrogenase (decarboxylating)